MRDAWKGHWPEYLMEATELALFMISACVFVVLLEHPESPLRRALPEAFVRRALMGVAMGTTAIAIVFSPLGKRSGAHFNPAVTLTFWRLKKVADADALWYAVFQFIGGAAGVALATLLLGPRISHPRVNFAATAPGHRGAALAFFAEIVISFTLMSVVLAVSSHPRLGRYTGLFAGALVATFITFESPISGMSMNPARTFASTPGSGLWKFLWIYFTAPPIGMLLAAEVRRRSSGAGSVVCAKLHHVNRYRCIFRCGYAPSEAPAARVAARG